MQSFFPVFSCRPSCFLLLVVLILLLLTSRTSGTYTLAAQVPHPLTLQFSNCRRPVRTPLPYTLFRPLHTVFRSPAYVRFGLPFWITLNFDMDDELDSAKDVSVSDPASTSTSSTPTTAAAVDIYARHSCSRCGRRMSALQFDKHLLCCV